MNPSKCAIIREKNDILTMWSPNNKTEIGQFHSSSAGLGMPPECLSRRRTEQKGRKPHVVNGGSQCTDIREPVVARIVTLPFVAQERKQIR